MRFRIDVSLVAAAIALAIVRPAFAQEPSPHDRAVELFTQSDKAYKEGDFREAAKDLEAAYGLEPAPVLLYNLARAYEGMGEKEAAIAAYERYLKVQPDADNRGLVEKRLEALRQEVARSKPPPPPNKPVVETHTRPLGAAPIAVALVGAAGLAAGGVFGSLALAQNAKQNDATTSQLDAKSAHDQGATFATVSNVSFIAGGVVALAGLVWILVDRLTATSTRPAASTPFVVRF